MKRFIILLFVLSTFTVYTQNSSIKWHKAFNNAIEQAYTENKMVIMFFADEESDKNKVVIDNLINSEAFNTIKDKFVFAHIERNSANTNTAMYNKRLTIHYNKSNSFPAVLVIEKNGAPKGQLQTEFTPEAIQTYLNFLKTL
ncbi:MAG: hypothetical protein AAF901_10075 [Bacteroidota bacterium]